MSEFPDLRSVLSRLLPSVETYWDRALQDYSVAAYTAEPVERSWIRKDAFRKLQNTFVDRATKLNFGSADVCELMSELENNPVLQTGPHCHLLIEPDAFFTHVFAALALRAKAQKWYLSYAVSTVKFVESAKKGPGWLWLDDRNINVFGLSRSEMIPYSIMGRQSDKQFCLVDEAGTCEAPASVALKNALPTGQFSSAAEAIKAANPMLWARIFGAQIRFLQIDDDDVRELVRQHLIDPQSWLRQNLFTDLEMPRAILHQIRKVDEGFWSGWFKSTTDFFWHLDKGKLKPLKLVGGRLQNQEGSFGVACDAQALADALELRIVIPNMFIAFLVLSILPGVKVLGGTRQIIYYPIMRDVLVSALIQSRRAPDRELAEEVCLDRNPSAWGHRTIAPTCRDPWGSIANDVEAFINMIRSRNLLTSAGDLPDFVSDPLWAKIIAADVGRLDSLSW